MQLTLLCAVILSSTFQCLMVSGKLGALGLIAMASSFYLNESGHFFEYCYMLLLKKAVVVVVVASEHQLLPPRAKSAPVSVSLNASLSCR